MSHRYISKIQYKGREDMYLWLKTDNMEIQEGNVLIIEYMGGTKEEWVTRSKVGGKSVELIWQNCELEQINGCAVGFPNTTSPNGYRIHEQYIHKDWNQLIPVVKRVQKELWELALPHPQSMVANTLRNVVAELDMKLIWEWAIEGIQLINEIKAKEDGTK